MRSLAQEAPLTPGAITGKELSAVAHSILPNTLIEQKAILLPFRGLRGACCATVPATGISARKLRPWHRVGNRE